MSPEGGRLLVLIRFDEGISEAQADEFVALLAAELEYRDLRDERYHKSGWGMGHSRVIKVTRDKEKTE